MTLLLLARHMFLCQSSWCQLGHMSLRRYQLPEPRGQGAGTPRSEGRGSVPRLLEENLSDCFAGRQDLPAWGSFFFFFFFF